MRGEVEAIPGKTMPNLKVVTRDYKNLYNQFVPDQAGSPLILLSRIFLKSIVDVRSHFGNIGMPFAARNLRR